MAKKPVKSAAKTSGKKKLATKGKGKAATTSVKKKLAAAKGKTATKAKTTAAKTPAKKTPAAKPAAKRKKSIGYELKQKNVDTINKMYESMQEDFDNAGAMLADYMFENNKRAAVDSKALFQKIAKNCKAIRAAIQESKTSMKLLYKD